MYTYRCAGARDASVSLVVGGGFNTGDVLYLSAPNRNDAAEAGVTLGGAPIADDATWNGHRVPLTASSVAGEIDVNVPACTAAIVRLSTV